MNCGPDKPLGEYIGASRWAATLQRGALHHRAHHATIGSVRTVGKSNVRRLWTALAVSLTPVMVSAEIPRADKPQPLVGFQVQIAGRMMGVDCNDWTLSEIRDDGNVLSTCGQYILETSGANDFNVVRLKRQDGQTMAEFLPYAPVIKFPLTVGSRWSADYSFYTMELDAPLKARASCEVAAWENVTVKAGEFPAFRIECTDNLSAGSRKFRTQSTRWYAPSASLVVKAENRQDPGRWNFEVAGLGFAGDSSGPAPVEAAAPAPVVSAPAPARSLDEVAPIMDINDY